MTSQNSRIANKTLKKNKVEDLVLPKNKPYHKAIINRTVCAGNRTDAKISLQRSKGGSVARGLSFQQMILEQLDIHLRKKNIYLYTDLIPLPKINSK